MHRLAFAAVTACVLAAGAALGAPVKMIHVTPTETQDLLANPGMGWQTFHNFADADRNLAGLPSGSAYIRWYWRDIEPQDGRMDFAKIDEAVAHAHRAGQKLCFRVMCTGSEAYMDVPQWLKDKRAQGWDFLYGGSKHWTPKWEDPVFLTAHYRLIAALGKRYGDNPDVDLVDIGSVGLWGEWHMSGCTIEGTGQPVPMPLPETRIAIIDAWRTAFPNKTKVMLIGDEPGLRYAAQHGCGWRADCLGDMGGFSKTWSHMRNVYRQQVEKTGAQDAWKTAPVAFESCWDMRKWVQEGWDVRYIFDYALDCHASYINNKSAPIPDGSRPEVERLLRKLGYRLVLRGLDLPASASGTLRLATAWDNVGVAPPYSDYRLAVRLTSASGDAHVVVSTTSVKGWLPGQHDAVVSLPLPAGVKGPCDVAIGLVAPGGANPSVRLAIEGRTADGWYPVGRVTVGGR